MYYSNKKSIIKKKIYKIQDCCSLQLCWDFEEW